MLSVRGDLRLKRYLTQISLFEDDVTAASIVELRAFGKQFFRKTIDFFVTVTYFVYIDEKYQKLLNKLEKV